MLDYQGSNPFANLFGHAGGGSQALGQQQSLNRRQAQPNVFASAGSGEDGLTLFRSQVKQGVINPNLNNPPLPAEGQGGRLFAMG